MSIFNISPITLGQEDINPLTLARKVNAEHAYPQWTVEDITDQHKEATSKVSRLEEYITAQSHRLDALRRSTDSLRSMHDEALSIIRELIDDNDLRDDESVHRLVELGMKPFTRTFGYSVTVTFTLEGSVTVNGDEDEAREFLSESLGECINFSLDDYDDGEGGVIEHEYRHPDHDLTVDYLSES